MDANRNIWTILAKLFSDFDSWLSENMLIKAFKTLSGLPFFKQTEYVAVILSTTLYSRAPVEFRRQKRS